jgi:hypothetical protein
LFDIVFRIWYTYFMSKTPSFQRYETNIALIPGARARAKAEKQAHDLIVPYLAVTLEGDDYRFSFARRSVEDFMSEPPQGTGRIIRGVADGIRGLFNWHRIIVDERNDYLQGQGSRALKGLAHHLESYTGKHGHVIVNHYDGDGFAELTYADEHGALLPPTHAVEDAPYVLSTSLFTAGRTLVQAVVEGPLVPPTPATAPR